MIDFISHGKWMQALPDLLSLKVSRLQHIGDSGDWFLTAAFVPKAISLHEQKWFLLTTLLSLILKDDI